MSENNTIQIKKDLQQITDMLLLNGTLTECPGWYMVRWESLFSFSLCTIYK